MASSRLDEFSLKLSQWREEFRVYGNKTEITKKDISRLSDLICAVENAESVLMEAEEVVNEFLYS